ncbi:MAG: L-threonylcarbamoyladenylate synthase [Bacteroidales bacterium]
MSDIRKEINSALKVLKEGGVILYPTDTIWGIGCDATNEAAVAKVYAIKERADTKSMLALIHTEALLASYVTTVPEIAWELIEAAVDPLTIIYPAAKNLAKNLIGRDQTIGIRITKDDFCTQLISRFRKPVVSTSANLSGHSAPANFFEINKSIREKVDYTVNWRQDDYTRAKPSSIIKLGIGGEINIIRK